MFFFSFSLLAYATDKSVFFSQIGLPGLSISLIAIESLLSPVFIRFPPFFFISARLYTDFIQIDFESFMAFYRRWWTETLIFISCQTLLELNSLVSFSENFAIQNEMALRHPLNGISISYPQRINIPNRCTELYSE